MKLFFKDKNKKLRGVKVDWKYTVVNEQAGLKQSVKIGSSINPKSPVLAVIK